MAAGGLRTQDVGFRSLREKLDATAPGGRLIFHVFAALAEGIRELIVSGTHEGLAADRGRPGVINPEILRAGRDMLSDPEASVASIAELLGVSPGMLYDHIPELRAAGRARAAALPA